MKSILITDPTLRDGNHAIKHQLSAEQIAAYCRMADAAGVPIVEVGHGNGIGASSLQLGESKCPDELALQVAREQLKHSKLGIHVIPGFATIEKDLERALNLGVDVVRVASHCLEADLTQRHIEYARNRDKTTFGALMMSHLATPEILLQEAHKMQAYGAQAIIFMDSSGHYLPQDVKERVTVLKEGLDVPVGFHAHNNLGMAIANSVAAAEAGATHLDACARGFGAGAGNAQIEVLVAVLYRMHYNTGIDLYKALEMSDEAELSLMKVVPSIHSTSVISGLAGVFSGFMKPVERIARLYELDPRDIFFELGKRNVIAGQEDYILEVAIDLANAQKERLRSGKPLLGL